MIQADVSLAPDSSRVVGDVRWAEGAGEPLDFPIDSLRIAADSIVFSFAPAIIEVRAACVTADSLGATVRWSTPGTETYTGYLRRLGNERT